MTDLPRMISMLSCAHRICHSRECFQEQSKHAAFVSLSGIYKTIEAELYLELSVEQQITIATMLVELDMPGSIDCRVFLIAHNLFHVLEES